MSSEDYLEEKIDVRPVIIGNKVRFYLDFEADSATIDFLNGIDLDMPTKLMDTVRASEDMYWRQQGAMLARQIYYQSIEVMFSMFLAAIQSPTYPVAWLINYKNQQLRELVQAISKRHPIPVFVCTRQPSWQGIVEYMLSTSNLSSAENFGEMCISHAKVIRDLAYDLVNDATVEEYNALKHGFRASHSGMAVSITAQGDSGTMGSGKSIVGVDSQNGSHFPIQELVDRDKNIWRVSLKSVPWDEEILSKRIEFVTMWAKIARAAMLARIARKNQEVVIPSSDLIEEAMRRPGSMTSVHLKKEIYAENLKGDLPAIDLNNDKYCWPSAQKI